MSDSPSIVSRAEHILSMMTPEEQDKAVRKSLWPHGVAPTPMFLALELARQEHRNGSRTAKDKLTKSLIAIGQAFKQIG